MSIERWPDDVRLLVNAEPEDGRGDYDIWHTGGPGGPWLTAISKEAAMSVIAVVDEVHELRAALKDAQEALANEHGRGTPPRPGWTYNAETGEWEHAELRLWVNRGYKDQPAWSWGRWDEDDSGGGDSARECMALAYDTESGVLDG